jgi:hypothetical protein
MRDSFHKSPATTTACLATHLEPDHLERPVHQVAPPVNDQQQVASTICLPGHPVPAVQDTESAVQGA